MLGRIKTLWFKVKFRSSLSFLAYFGLFCRSAVKNFGIERFKSNCLRATEGFNFVLHHLNNQTTVANIRDMRAKWKEMKDRGEEAFYGKMGNIKSIVVEKS